MPVPLGLTFMQVRVPQILRNYFQSLPGEQKDWLPLSGSLMRRSSRSPACIGVPGPSVLGLVYLFQVFTVSQEETSLKSKAPVKWGRTIFWGMAERRNLVSLIPKLVDILQCKLCTTLKSSAYSQSICKTTLLLEFHHSHKRFRERQHGLRITQHISVCYTQWK